MVLELLTIKRKKMKGGTHRVHLYLVISWSENDTLLTHCDMLLGSNDIYTVQTVMRGLIRGARRFIAKVKSIPDCTLMALIRVKLSQILCTVFNNHFTTNVFVHVKGT